MLNVALLIPRVIIGLLFIGHGTQKLFGWFGGSGPRATASFFDQIGLKPASLLAIIAGLLESIGGLGLVLGLATPLAAAMVTATMLGAIAFVHWPKGIWAAKGGFEYPLVMAATAALYGLAGPGAEALDASIHLAVPGPRVYLLSVLVGLLVVLALRLAGIWSVRPRQTAPTRA